MKSGTRQFSSTYGYRTAGQADERIDILDGDAETSEHASDSRVTCSACLIAALKITGAAIRRRLARRGCGDRKNCDGGEEESESGSDLDLHTPLP